MAKLRVNKATISNVLPKKSHESWRQFSEGDLALYITRLGNQALLRAGDNSDLKSAGFTEKKEIY